jgi:hypothetical protein
LWVGDLVCPNRDCLRQIAVCAGKDQQSPDHELEDSRRNSSPTPQLGTRSKKRAEIPSIICEAEKERLLYQWTDFGRYLRL